MKTNEFRQGNLLNYYGQTVIVLETLRHNKVELGYFTDSVGFSRDINEVKPILITKNWLREKPSSVVEDEGSYYIDCEGFRVYIMLDEGGNFENDGKALFCGGPDDKKFIVAWHAVECRYVHQLQNLYFILKEEELW